MGEFHIVILWRGCLRMLSNNV